MGKKYLLEIEENKDGSFAWSNFAPYAEPDLEQVRKEAYKDGYNAGFGKKIDASYQEGLNDAWEAARTLWNTPNRKEIFGHTTFNTVLTTLTAQETIEKIRQYEQEKDAEIKVGDEVIPHHITADSTPVIVTRKWKDDYNQDAIHTIGYDGRTNCFLEEHVKKTGRHFEIAEVLEKMREESNG